MPSASLPLDDFITDSALQVHRARQVHEDRRQALRHRLRDQQLRADLQHGAAEGRRPPATFDEFLATAKAATANGIFGFAYRATMAEARGILAGPVQLRLRLRRTLERRTRQPDAQQPEGHRGRRRLQEGLRRRRDPRRAPMPRLTGACSAEGKLAMEIDNGGVAGIWSASRRPTCSSPQRRRRFPTRAQGLILAPHHGQRQHQAQGGRGHLPQVGPAAREPEGAAGAPGASTSRPPSSARRKSSPSSPGSRSMTTRRRTACPQLVAGPRDPRRRRSSRSSSSRC